MAEQTPGFSRAEPRRLTDVMLGHEGLLLAVKDSAGKLIAAYGGGDAALPADVPVLAARDADAAAVRDWHGANRAYGRVIAAWAVIGRAPSSQVLLVVARKESERLELLRSYRTDIVAAVLGGALATALLGYAVSRRGLRPVLQLANAASRITSAQLGARLSIADAPAEMTDMVLAFNGMLSRLEESFRRLSQFSTDIAHDLRTPIGNLMVETQVALAQRRTVPEYEALLASNVEEYERLSRMVESMLFLARAENAQVALHKEMIAVDEELRRITEYFQGMADEAGVKLDIDGSGALVADIILFRRAVSNLMANALRHTPRGESIAIRVRLKDPRALVVEVSNPGPGIAPEHHSRIFDRFYRVDSARDESHSSSGLGLAIVKSIMILHGGEAQVEAEPGGITTFRLYFPSTPI